MAQYYKLIDVADSAETFSLPHRENGRNVYKFYTLYPGRKYVEHIDDELFVKTLKEDCHKKIPYTPEREDILKACDARYEITMCKVCGGGQAKKLDVWLVEVVE